MLKEEFKTTLSFLKEIKSIYARSADKEKASAMKAYMKGKFNYFGIQKPMRQELLKPFWPKLKNIPSEALEESIRWLWSQPQRELHYLAMELLFKNKKQWNKNTLVLLEELIVRESWWDTVDYIAATLVGYYFQKFPEHVKTKAIEWSKSENMWINRTAILFQLKYKEKTDFNLLLRVIDPHRESKEFFHQKAIGWALRQYAYTDMKAVKSYVANTPLKPLSVREALKHA